MAVKNPGAYQVARLRITKLGPCGEPLYSPCSVMVINCFASVQINPDINETDPITPGNADGSECFFIPGAKQDRGFNVNIVFNRKFPQVFTALNPNWLTTVDEEGDIVGFTHVPIIGNNQGVAIEGWELTAGDTCVPGAEGEWNYFLLPRVTNWSRQDLELGNSAHVETWGGHTLAPNQWGVGPFNVRRNATTDVAGPLIGPLPTNSGFYDEVVTLAPPAVTDECEPLSNPAGPAVVLNSCAGQDVTITATTVGARPMQVNWGDGTAPAAIVTATATPHTYADPGRYVITVNYTDGAQEARYVVVTVPCA